MEWAKKAQKSPTMRVEAAVARSYEVKSTPPHQAHESGVMEAWSDYVFELDPTKPPEPVSLEHLQGLRRTYRADPAVKSPEQGLRCVCWHVHSLAAHTQRTHTYAHTHTGTACCLWILSPPDPYQYQASPGALSWKMELKQLPRCPL
eukprot:1158266-Pelagomonas_calceolata.AAC.8